MVFFALPAFSDCTRNLPCRISENCPDAAVLHGYGKCLSIKKVLRIPCYLEVGGGLQDTEVLALPILCKTNRQPILRIQHPSIPGLCGEKNQTPKANNPAIVGLRLLDNIIRLPVYANLVATYEPMVSSLHIIFPSRRTIEISGG